VPKIPQVKREIPHPDVDLFADVGSTRTLFRPSPRAAIGKFRACLCGWVTRTSGWILWTAAAHVLFDFSGLRAHLRAPDGADMNRTLRTTLKSTLGLLAVASGAYAGYVGMTWLRYGHPDVPAPDDADSLLDRFMPAYDVTERHHIDIAAPADVTFASACEQDLMALPLARAIFKARAMLLGSERDATIRPHGLVALTKSIGWGVLAEIPGQEVVMGAVTQPWRADVVFRALPANEFIEFDEPGYVKIAWTLRADTRDATTSTFRTETRALATDATARFKFRRYWAFLSPGIVLIRRASLKPLRTEAERRAQSEPRVTVAAPTATEGP
jgi:hypothetical protein